MLKRSLLLAGLALGLCLGCSDDDSPVGPVSIKGSGTLESEERSLGPLHSVSMRMPGTIELTYGEEQSLTVTADDNILQYIDTEDSSGTLIIRVKAGSAVSEYELTVEATLTELRSVTSYSPGIITGTNRFAGDAINAVLAGAGPITLDVEAQALSTVLSGAGQLALSGTAIIHSTVLSGVGSIEAFDLSTVTTSVVHEGAGNVKVRASDLLTVVLTGAGSVYYKGQPVIESTDTGPGSIVDAN